MMPFTDLVTSEEAFRALIGTPSKLVQHKVIHHLDSHCRDFITKSPFVMVGTSDDEGRCDVSPRGDAPGFVRVLDDQHLLIPERPGNRRIDSIKNILKNPGIGLMFLIPGLEETFRVNGQACVTTHAQSLQPCSVSGRTPVLGIGVTVEECFVHCAKALKRSRLWHPETWLDEDDQPNIARMLSDHAKLPEMDEQAVQAVLEESYTKRLY